MAEYGMRSFRARDRCVPGSLARSRGSRGRAAAGRVAAHRSPAVRRQGAARRKTLGKRLPPGTDVRASLKRLALEYAPRGVNLVQIGNTWAFRTANDLAWLLTQEAVEPKKLSRAAIETLAIIAYHQPVTRAEIEEIRGVAAAKGTLDVLLETGWIRPRGRRKAPGRPLTFGTTEGFLSHFGLERLTDLPGLDELKGAGLFDGHLPENFRVPAPSDDPALNDDEEPLEPADLDLGLAPRLDLTSDAGTCE